MPGVRQDNCRADAFGLKAVVVKQNMSALTLSMQQVKKDGSFQNFIYECEVEDVVPWDEDQMQAMKMKSFSTVTNGEKRFMVKQIWGNDLGDTDSSRNGEMLADTDLTAIFEYLQFQYQQPKVAMATPSAVKLACVEGASTPEGAACILDIKAIMKTSTHVVIPVHAEMPKHWTAILLEMETLGSIKVKRAYYFDWLKPLQVRNRNYARKILRLLTLENDLSYMQLAAPHNKYVQRIGSNDCGFVVWYAMEVAMKQQRLEGSWNLMPRPDLWRATLNTALKNLLKEQQKWILEDLTPKKKNWIPAFEIVLPGQKHVDKEKMIEELHKVIIGQDAVIHQILAAIFTGGHCLLVGVPGLAKTLIVSTIAKIAVKIMLWNWIQTWPPQPASVAAKSAMNNPLASAPQAPPTP